MVGGHFFNFVIQNVLSLRPSKAFIFKGTAMMMSLTKKIYIYKEAINAKHVATLLQFILI